ncbi:hypothetical protein BGW36DRAFT_357942 [Talaromyces proteolyticus]|uniref:chitinase n=1 Tax=Talaromyces proteolyticus TaxID=1131652 RepID=A0AAD4KQT3_9EURO|nr:uncharacterized protein BGW36DRAFT_357942 [Talaromyces proteolyticus]KAH8698404.1 hypothetical protein BGW36DRAFT_357942 [Talaromyces proteolyticus]
MIPLGIYTHINVAFAVIDPETFEIRPSMRSDIDIYERVTYLKSIDPDLKVFIAIGGWAFNDPGPSATTFSDLASSEEKQKTFFRSLTKFMATYNFDGIDIDWEYPSASDRSGRPEDFKNFPKFMKNLKAALKATGGRDGLSMTLPASYWYLKHFDIKHLVQHIDFFNIMTYDMHGTWDKGNQWTGEFLNAHTNLTEIKNSMDLIWRNEIPPDKVVLGMAFYGRAFTMVDPSCNKPGCLFASGADPGECSNEIGILMNSEISKIINDKKVEPTLYKDEAVKIATWDDQWVGYDDADTFELKTNFARSQCLGGIMVWAISQDLLDGTYSRALGRATNRSVIALADHAETNDTETVLHEQCKWTNCGDGCPSGWVTVPRSDPDKREGEIMLDDGGCLLDGQFHVLCCPPKKDVPTCGWYTFNNGDCDGKCPGNMYEIGGTQRGCSGYKGNYQAACCTGNSDAMAIYRKCEWGASFNCDDYTCSVTKPDIVALSVNGNGGSVCGGDWRTDLNEERKYCCDSSDDNMKWDDCTWEDHYSSTGMIATPKGSGNSFCASNCPDNKVRVAMEHYNTCSRKLGSRAKCCTPKYTTTVTTVDPEFAEMEADLKAWLANATCSNSFYSDGWTYGSMKKRSLWPDHALKNSTLTYMLSGPESAIHEKRQDQPFIIYTSNSALLILNDIIRAWRSSLVIVRAQKEFEAWDQIIGAQYAHLTTAVMLPFIKQYFNLYNIESSEIATQVICDLQEWDQMIEACSISSNNITCSNIDRDKWDPEYSVDPDTYGTSSGSVSRRGVSFPDGIFTLDKRDGAGRDFIVDCGIDPVTGQRRVMIITSQTYPNGNNGNSLQNANRLTARFALANPEECTDVTIDPNAPNNVWDWVTEHILELQLIPRSIEFMVTGRLPPVQGLPEYRSTNALMPWDSALLLTKDYSNTLPTVQGTPIDRIFNALGSKKNPGVLRNAETHLNSMKGRIFHSQQPIGDTVWNTMNLPDVNAARAALDELRVVISVFEYLNSEEIGRTLADVYQAVGTEMRTFEKAAKIAQPAATFRPNVLWREFMVNFFSRMIRWVRTWLVDHLNDLTNTWQTVYNRASDDQTRMIARRFIGEIDLLRARLGSVQFDTSTFIFMS